MSLRRVAGAASTVMVALVVALAVPVSQLRTVMIIHTCCCPDPDDCHCPKPKPDDGKQPTMRTCHQSTVAIVAPQLPSFTGRPVVAIAAPDRIAVAPIARIAQPHASPILARPDGPS